MDWKETSFTILDNLLTNRFMIDINLNCILTLFYNITVFGQFCFSAQSKKYEVERDHLFSTNSLTQNI